jgi:hypothetical protein
LWVLKNFLLFSDNYLVANDAPNNEAANQAARSLADGAGWINPAGCESRA